MTSPRLGHAELSMLLAVAVCMQAVPVSVAEEAAEGISQWRVRSGVFESSADISVSGSSYSPAAHIPSHARAGHVNSATTVGDASSYANRLYSDGYVNMDYGTATWRKTHGTGAIKTRARCKMEALCHSIEDGVVTDFAVPVRQVILSGMIQFAQQAFSLRGSTCFSHVRGMDSD